MTRRKQIGLGILLLITVGYIVEVMYSSFAIRKKLYPYFHSREMAAKRLMSGISNNSNTLQTSYIPQSKEFKDEYFEPILHTYRAKASGTIAPQIKSFRFGPLPRVLIWSKPFYKDFWKSQVSHIEKGLCALPCQVFFDEQQRETADVILIYLRGAKDSATVTHSLSPRDISQPWIVLNFETHQRANSIHKSNYESYNDLFNRTMMYRWDSDIRVPHGFIVKRGDDVNALPKSWVIPPVMDRGKKKRKTAVAFISNCQSLSNRLQYIRDVDQYVEVDIYGRCGDLSCGHSMYVDHKYNVTLDPCLKMAGEGYLFYFAFENSFCEAYLTEKAYNLLYYPIVPIVRGSAYYAAYFPPNSYIDASKLTPEDLARKIIYLRDNPLEYEKYLEWRQWYQPSTIGGERTLCHLCTRLYDKDLYEYNVIEDFKDWFVTKSHCLQ